MRLGFSGLDLRAKELCDLCILNFNEVLLMEVCILKSVPHCALTLLWTFPLTAWLFSLLALSPFFLFSPSLSLFLPSSGCLAFWVVSSPFDEKKHKKLHMLTVPILTCNPIILKTKQNITHNLDKLHFFPPTNVSTSVGGGESESEGAGIGGGGGFLDFFNG